MIVLLFALLGSSTTFLILAEDNLTQDMTFQDSLFINYRISLGDFDTTDYTMPQIMLFLLSSFFMTLVMLNLLIAIMGDSFDRVSSMLVESDGYELNQLILE